jgi:uncharacterized protein (DUF362 family)
MNSAFAVSRRGFLKSLSMGGVAAWGAAHSAVRAATSEAPAGMSPTAALPASRVALTAGEDHPDIVFRGLKSFSREISAAIGTRRVVIKPNNVAVDIPLSATHADCIEGILEFLKSVGKLDQAVIAESAANGPTFEGFANYGYDKLARKYGVKMVDLDREPTGTVHVWDEKDFRPHAVRVARMLLERDSFIISAAKFKTHDRIVATLSLKNIVVGAPVKDEGFRWGKRCKPGATNQKPIIHGHGFYGVNYNLFALARQLRPDLAVIDGFQGMEGNGPCQGTAVEQRVCVVSPDWLAADRVALELMGIELAKVGYLQYCAEAGMGQADLGRIEILGEPVARHVRKYKLHDRIDQQLRWLAPPRWS